MTITKLSNKTNIDENEASQLIQQLKGMRVSNPWRGYGSAMFMELGSLHANRSPLNKHRLSSNPKGDVTIMVEWSWRVEDESSIIVGSWSDDEEIDKVPGMLQNLIISNVVFFGVQREIQVAFKDGLCFSSFSTVESDPQWAIGLHDDTWLGFEDGSFWKSY